MIAENFWRTFDILFDNHYLTPYKTSAFDSKIAYFAADIYFFTRWSLKRGGMYRKNYELKEQQRFDEKISEATYLAHRLQYMNFSKEL